MVLLVLPLLLLLVLLLSQILRHYINHHVMTCLPVSPGIRKFYFHLETFIALKKFLPLCPLWENKFRKKKLGGGAK
jgi:hypothetical protein